MVFKITKKNWGKNAFLTQFRKLKRSLSFIFITTKRFVLFVLQKHYARGEFTSMFFHTAKIVMHRHIYFSIGFTY